MNDTYMLKKYKEEQELYIQYHKFISPNNIGLTCNVGWLPVVRELFEYLDANNIRAQVVQIKEKFGDLRVYFDSDNATNAQYSQAWRILDKSCTMCDICGGVGDKQGSVGWIVTRCKEHKSFKDQTNYGEILEVIGPLEAELRKLIGPRTDARSNPWAGVKATVSIPVFDEER